MILLSVAPGSVTTPDLLRVGYDWKAQNSRRLELAAQLLPQNDELLNQLNADSEFRQNAPYSGFLNMYNGDWTNPFATTLTTTMPPVILSGKFGCTAVSTLTKRVSPTQIPEYSMAPPFEPFRAPVRSTMGGKLPSSEW